MINKRIRFQEELTDIDCDAIECRHAAQYCTNFKQLHLGIISKMNIDGFAKLCSKHYELAVAIKGADIDKLIFLGDDNESYRCSRCGYEWMSYFYGHRLPKTCRKCRSPRWKAPYKRRDQVHIIRRLTEIQKGVKLENNK